MPRNEDYDSTQPTSHEPIAELSLPNLVRTGATVLVLIVLTSIAWRVDSRLHASLTKKRAATVVRAEPTKIAPEPIPEVLPRPEKMPEKPPEALEKPAVEKPLLDADRYFEQAADHYEAKNYKAAAEALRQGLSLEPDNSTEQAMLAMVLSYQGEWEESSEAYRKALQYEPKNALLHLGLAVALHRQERIEEAVASLERAVDLSPEMEEAQRMLDVLVREPEGTLEKVWFEHNVRVKGWEGFWIHTVTTVKFWNKRQGILRAVFLREGGRPVSGTFSNLVLANGQAAIEGPFTPPHRKTRYKDLHLFFPYKGLRLEEGDHRLKVQVELEDPKGRVLATRWASVRLEVLKTAYGAVEKAKSTTAPAKALD